MNGADIARRMDREGARTLFIDVSTGRSFSYAEMKSLSLALAGKMRLLGVGRQQRVCMLLPNAPEFVCVYLACLFMGAVAVPINPALPRRDIDFIMTHAGSSLTIYARKTADLIPESMRADRSHRRLCLTLEHEKSDVDADPTWSLASHTEPIEVAEDGDADDLFSITFTSGTTSRPKGVPHRVGALLASAGAFNRALGFTQESRFYHVLSMSYMAGFLNTLLCPLLAGGSVVSNGPFDAKLSLDFWRPAIRHEVNTLWLVPTMLTSLLKLDRGAVGAGFCRSAVRAACVGTAPLPLKLKNDFEEKYGVALYESYGLSETLFVASNSAKVPYEPGSAGRLLDGADVRIVDPSGGDVPAEGEGEIHIRVAWAMPGYLDINTGQPDSATSPEWFPSGDLGKLSTDGHLFITGRKKDLIIRGGINISPRAVEEILMQHPAVQEVAVVGVPHDFYGEDMVACIKFRDGYAIEQARAELGAWCRNQLGASYVPSRFVDVPELPKNATGKVLKNDLKAWLVSPEAGSRSS